MTFPIEPNKLFERVIDFQYEGTTYHLLNSPDEVVLAVDRKDPEGRPHLHLVEWTPELSLATVMALVRHHGGV